ncbi:hypothetical protein GF312_17240 [Candidatus Poribacteria bacterium]|nr:hypothetical protein [Candidatus Poribacteria bacterium]
MSPNMSAIQNCEKRKNFDDIETQVRCVMLEIGIQTVESIIRARGTGF